MLWNYVVIISCICLTVFALIKEYLRADKQRLALRITASVVGIAALAAIALPISYQSETTDPVNEAVLLTPGFSKDSLSKFKNDTIYTTDEAINKQHPKTEFITIDQLKKVSPAIARLHILGYGLAKDELKQLDSLPATFHPANTPTGIVLANWSQKIGQGQHFTVQGKINNPANSQIRLILKELNTSVDSATINQSGNIDFELNSLPKSSGRLTDHLLVLSGHDTIANEPLPFIVNPVTPSKILVLASAPDFENKFLKNWLTTQGYSVAVRSAASKDKFTSEFVNIEKLPLEKLSTSTLEKFDVVIADVSSLQALSGTETGLLKQQVNQNGLGLIIRADTILKNPSSLQNNFPVYKAAAKEQKGTGIQLQGEKNPLKTQASNQLFISNKDEIQNLATDGQNHILAGIALAGTGKIICTTLDNTYNWMLAGNKDDYTSFWSLLIGNATKPVLEPESWATITPIPTVNSPVIVQLETAAQPGQILMDGENASPKQNSQLPFQWQSTWWVKQPGWHAIQHSGGTSGWIYIYNTTDWTTMRAANKISETKKYISGLLPTAVTKQIQRKVEIEVPKLYFYILLLLCCTFLWVEGKMPAKPTR